MTIFVSYARADVSAAETLVRDVESAQYPVWVDRKLGGGQIWWDEILSQIGRASVFLLILSQHSLASPACRAELRYAMDLGVPILPVRIDDAPVGSSPVSQIQIVDYRRKDAAAGMALLAGLQSQAAAPRRAPAAPPTPPPVPHGYLMTLGSQVSAERLDREAQVAIAAQVRVRLREETDVGARQELVGILAQLRRHPDVSVAVAAEVDDILKANKVGKVPTNRETGTTTRRAGPVVWTVVTGIWAFFALALSFNPATTEARPWIVVAAVLVVVGWIVVLARRPRQ